MFDPMRTGYADKMINFIQQSSLHENFDICQNL